MSALTLFDARNAATVRKALDDAIAGGHSRARVIFSGHYATITARVQGNGQWTVTGTFGACYMGKDSQTRNLDTDQAVATIVALATNKDKD